MVSLDIEDDEDSNASSSTTENILSGLNGGTAGERSVSNTAHGRSRLTSNSAPSVNGGSSTTAGRHHHSHPTRNPASFTSPQHHHHHNSNSSRRNDGERVSSTSSSTSTAKESFLNYFFGQNGPGPVAGANITNATSEVHGHFTRVGGTVGRDVSGPESTAGAFLRARNGLNGDGSDAAFDMKSLGKHIEAVSPHFPFQVFAISLQASGPTLRGVSVLVVLRPLITPLSPIHLDPRACDPTCGFVSTFCVLVFSPFCRYPHRHPAGL